MAVAWADAKKEEKKKWISQICVMFSKTFYFVSLILVQNIFDESSEYDGGHLVMHVMHFRK